MACSPNTHELALAGMAPPTAATTVPGATHKTTARTPAENFEVVLKKAHEAAEGSTRHGFKQKRLIVASALHCCSRSLGVPNVVIALSPGAHYLQTRIVRPTGGHGVEGERDRETESERKTRGIACCIKEQLRWLWIRSHPLTLLI